MKLVVNGCSNTACMIEGKLYPEFSWANFLSIKTNIVLENLAVRGSSLERILRTTIEYFSENNNFKGLYIVGIPGGVVRWEVLKNNKWYPNGNNYISTKNLWLKNISKAMFEQDSDYWIIKDFIYLISLQNYLKNKKISYLFFNSGPAVMKDLKFKLYQKELDISKYIGNPYEKNDSMIGYLENKKYKQDKMGHFYKEGQYEGANYLFRNIKI